MLGHFLILSICAILFIPPVFAGDDRRDAYLEWLEDSYSHLDFDGKRRLKTGGFFHGPWQEGLSFSRVVRPPDERNYRTGFRLLFETR